MLMRDITGATLRSWSLHMRRALHMIGLSLGLLALAGCTRGEDSANVDRKAAETFSSASAPTKGTIGVSVLTMQNPFFKVIAENIQQEAARVGYNVDVRSGDEDVAKQRDQVKEFIVNQVAAIVLCPVDSKSIGQVIKEANGAGIPVFTTDIACLDPDAKVVSHIGTDNHGGGKEAARAMIEALGEAGGRVAILDHKRVESCIMRVKGFKEVIHDHNAANPHGKVEIVVELPSGGSTPQGYRSTEDLLQSHPDVAGIFAINDPSALGARAALEKAGKADQVVIVGFDGQPDGRQAIKEGKIYADPIQFPDRMGVETVRAVVRHFAGEPVEPYIPIATHLYRKADAEKDETVQ
jgi:ribose transport system substrate-binding protein